MIRYLSVDQVVRANLRDGGPGAGVRDLGVIEAAVARPSAGFGGQEAHPGLFDKAAALLHGLASTQGFHDGNKRAAWTAVHAFLELNGRQIHDMPTVEAETFVLAVSTNLLSLSKIAEWLLTATGGARSYRDHRVEYAMLARGANVDEDGLLSLLGGGGSFTAIVVPSLPSPISFAACARIHWDEADRESDHNVGFRVISPTGAVLPPGWLGYKLGHPIGQSAPHHPSGIVPFIIAVTIVTFLEEAGWHNVMLFVDDEPAASIPLRIVVANVGATPPTEL